ncbi:TetR/AcrR family transcriptional regulator [Winogradskyella bathintestinalis]|uniref:TetR/AcrR family transcriptional regulator n=1 Tax=Winogradskyella bathintestinalis TaxID=3035208 RepID=A0ABT7ZT65_9FLAO|nr:TetR/AcrR family transcriptional regulator [Winogradskyella bathintestinalis]MDN3492180.1 TetR/AcrR family transcriptional regulator [Winogradskyella bathintestinalis]
MARKKAYIEEEVVDKAMQLFWRRGYENTSMQMLEKEMGINKFSIYSSFGSKHGLFLESIKCYKSKTKTLFENLKNGLNGVEDIKAFFYESVALNLKMGNQNGCLVTNTYNEFIESDDELIKEQMNVFMDNLKTIFIEKLKMDSTKNEDTVLKQANFLLLAKHGLAAASRVNTPQEIEDYIEMTFKNL